MLVLARPCFFFFVIVVLQPRLVSGSGSGWLDGLERGMDVDLL